MPKAIAAAAAGLCNAAADCEATALPPEAAPAAYMRDERPMESQAMLTQQTALAMQPPKDAVSLCQ